MAELLAPGDAAESGEDGASALGNLA